MLVMHDFGHCPFFAFNHHRDDLLGQDAVGLGLGGALLAAISKGILVLAGNP
ncbi:hypothetical protein D3C76_1843530 [compost metagenome]